MKQRKNETKEEFNARANEYMKARYKEAMEWLQQYKIEKGCADCYYNDHPAALQVDHLVGRNGDGNKLIGRMAVRGINVLRRELADCEVVCSNCHSIRTWHRKVHPTIMQVSNAISAFDDYESCVLCHPELRASG